MGLMRAGNRRGERGAIAVEAALTLPIMLLLTVGGLSVLWWLYNKAMMQLAVAEVARERAGDGMLVGYYKDIRDTFYGPPKDYVVPDMRFASFHLPVDPPLVMAAACNAPGGVVPRPGAPNAPAEPQRSARRNEGWLGPVQDVREFLEGQVGKVEKAADVTEPWADQAVKTGEQLVFYRKMLESLRGQEPHQQRQVIDYLTGGVLELGMGYLCSREAEGGAVVVAKAVIQGERTFPQR